MTEVAERRVQGRAIAVAAVAAVVLTGVIVVVTNLTSGDAPAPISGDTSTNTPADDTAEGDEVGIASVPVVSALLPKAMSGQEAIDALGDNIVTVAKKNGKTVEELEALLLRDSSAHIMKDGFILYIDAR